MNRTLIATWCKGLFELADSTNHAFAGRSVGALTCSLSGRVLGIVDRHTIVERIAAGEWRDVAKSQQPLSCLVSAGEEVFVGTDDASILKLGSARELQPLDGFATVEGREYWYAGTAIINGEEVGPPLGVRSMTVTSDESALLANVHVGGIARSAGIVDTACIGTLGSRIAIADRGGHVYESVDCGWNWSLRADGLGSPSAVVL